MTQVINDSVWTARRERAPLVWKVEKVEPRESAAKIKTIIVSARPRERQESVNEADLSLAA